MNRSRYNMVIILTAFFVVALSHRAQALCVLSGVSVSPLTASTGTYTPLNSPSAQPITITVSGNYLAVAGDLVGGCELAIAFNRTSLPATMGATFGGSAKLPYALQSLASGGNTLIYTGGGVPTSSNALLLNFPASSGALVSAAPFSVSGTVWALAQPVDPQQAGGYQDNIVANVFSSTLAGILVLQASSQTFTVTGQVSKSCTIGGVAHPATDSAVIPISSNGGINTAPINRSYANALCNTPSSLQLSSQNGAVVTTSSISGLQNYIDYLASAAFSGALATLDTSANPSASGVETGSQADTSGTTPSGTLSVTITPELNTKKLVAGAYHDTLTIAIIPK